MKLKTKILSIIGVFLLAAITVFFGSEWNRAAFGSQGYIEKGEKFSVKIGAIRVDVINHLTAQGLVNISTLGIKETHYNPQSCHSHIYGDEYEVELWDDDSWRRGTICTAFIDEKLTRMSWWYGMFQP